MSEASNACTYLHKCPTQKNLHTRAPQNSFRVCYRLSERNVCERVCTEFVPWTNTNKHTHPIKVFVCYRLVWVSVRHHTYVPQTYTNTLNKYTSTHAPPITCFVSSIYWLVMCLYMSEISNVRVTYSHMYLTQIQTHTRTRTRALTHTHSYPTQIHTHSDALMHTNTYPRESLARDNYIRFRVYIRTHTLYK